MMGTKERSFAPLVHVSLEELVPADHFYRHLERTLDLSFVREFVHESYAGGGRPSIDPVVFFKLQLVMFFEGLRSERQLMRHAADRLSMRWFVGYDLDEPLPDHSSLTRIRTRYGVDVFRRFFEAIVEQCQHAKLVWGRELYIDGTKVQANASTDSLKPRFFVEAHLSTLFSNHAEEATEEGEQDASQEESASPELSPQGEQSSPMEVPSSLSPEQWCELSQQNEARHDWIEQLGAQDRQVKGRSYQRMADYLDSTTDPDATLMETTKGADMGYRTHYVVDGGKARIILGVLVTPSEVMDNQPMRDLVFRACFRQQDFQYDAKLDVYVCPAGKELHFCQRQTTERSRRYRARAKDCNHCPLKAKCTTSTQGRSLCRSVDEQYLDRVRGYHSTEAYKKALRKRQVWVEPLFARSAKTGMACGGFVYGDSGGSTVKD
jgi:transposase